ncbi:hypothetical protein [Terrabacter sp. Ter38]|uniref:hypothetical protein n=1 Tax=Terrabacter sp. Ter38 TaxID=2926030 RepID=UPI002118E8A8|nr:hypothetical protein [Terrabacter sp. Ter38]
MDADITESGGVILTLSNAELVVLREAIAFADFSGDLAERSAAEIEVLSRFLRTVDPLIPALGSDHYDRLVTRAWDEIAPG